MAQVQAHGAQGAHFMRRAAALGRSRPKDPVLVSGISRLRPTVRPGSAEGGSATPPLSEEDSCVATGGAACTAL